MCCVLLVHKLSRGWCLGIGPTVDEISELVVALDLVFLMLLSKDMMNMMVIIVPPTLSKYVYIDDSIKFEISEMSKNGSS